MISNNKSRHLVNKTYRKNRPKGRGKGKQLGAHESHMVINTTQHYGKATYPKLPREIEFSSIYSTYDIRAANTTPSTQKFGLIDFYNQLPAYAASFYQIYKYARINAITLDVEVVCTGTAPVIIAADVLPFTQANSASVDPHFIASRPRAISKIAGGSAGMNKIRLRKTWKTAESTGQVDYSDVAWQSYSEALSVTPDPDHPFLCVTIDSVLTTDVWAAMTVYHVTYHMQFFEQQDPSLTTTPEQFKTSRQRYMEFDSLEQPKQSSRLSPDDSFQSRRRR